jgi:sulfate transport system permease protein
MKKRVLPGYPAAMTLTLVFTGLVILLPLSTVLVMAAREGLGRIVHIVGAPRALAAYELTFGAALVAGAIAAPLGLLTAWTLSRYDFRGRRLLDALIDLPFALPTAVSGLALATIYGPHGWIGRRLPFRVAYTRAGVVVALVFVGFPFIVRTLQPVIASLPSDVEEAAATLGAGRFTTFRRVILPNLVPPLLTGFALAVGRGIGEYGSVIFISNNLPGKTEIAALLIMARLDEFDYGGAAVIALVMLLMSFAILFAVNRTQAWTRRRIGETT